MSQLQYNEDVYMSIIHELQYDRMRLKGKDMLERIQKLNNSNTAFGTLMKQISKQEIKLNAAEEEIVTKAIKEVGGLKTALKRQMAKARVVDLTQTSK